MRGERTTWDAHWQEIADYVQPRKDNIYKSKVLEGDKKGNLLYDASAIHANELLASALHSMLSNPATFFFTLTTGDNDLDLQDDVRVWIQKTTRKIHDVLNNSNFQQEIHEVYLDLASFGTSCMRIEEDEEIVVRFHTRPIYEVYVDENNKGEIDTIYREFEWTRRQIEQEFGEDVWTANEKMQMSKDENKKYCIIHAVMPRTDAMMDKRVGKGNSKAWKFASYYVHKEMKKTLREDGFKEFPYVTPRWTKISGEKYGRSPSMKALPDIKMINQVMKTTIRGAQKVVDPPLIVPDDGSFRPIKTTPSAINYKRAGSKDTIEPLLTGGKIDLGFQLMEDLRIRIRQAYFIDQLQLQEGPQMTATEVLQRTEENMRLLGPVLGRQHFELLKPFIFRVMAIMGRKGLIEPAPEQVEFVDVKYSSMIAKAQRTTEAENFNRVLATIAPMAQMKPEILDNINEDALVDWLADIYNLPPQLITTAKEVQQVRQARAQAQQQSMAQADRAQEAENVGKAGPTLVKAAEQQASR